MCQVCLDVGEQVPCGYGLQAGPLGRGPGHGVEAAVQGAGRHLGHGVLHADPGVRGHPAVDGGLGGLLGALAGGVVDGGLAALHRGNAEADACAGLEDRLGLLPQFAFLAVLFAHVLSFSSV